MIAVVIECLVDGQTDSSETVDFHDVIAEIVEDVVLRQIGHHLIEQHDILVRNVASRHVVVVECHFLIRTGPSSLQIDRLGRVVVGKDVVVNDGFERRRHTIRIRLNFQSTLILPYQIILKISI